MVTNDHPYWQAEHMQLITTMCNIEQFPFFDSEYLFTSEGSHSGGLYGNSASAGSSAVLPLGTWVALLLRPELQVVPGTASRVRQLERK